MRKDLWKLAVPAAALLLALSGCSGQKAPEETAASAEETEETAEETAAEETKTGETEEEQKEETAESLTPEESSEAAAAEEQLSALSVPKLSPEEYPGVNGSTATLPLSYELYHLSTGVPMEEAERTIAHSKTTAAYFALMYKYSVDYSDKNTSLVIAYEPSEEVYREMKSDPAYALEMKPIGKDALVFLANAGNPVESLTEKQIQDIYGGKVKNWSKVGGKNMDIQAFQRPENSGSQNLMEKLVMKGLPMGPAPFYYVEAEMEGLLEKVASYNNEDSALGYSVYYYARNMKDTPGLRFMAVNGVAPDSNTIRDESYPYVNAFYAAIRKDAPADSPERKLYDWLTTEDGQKMIAMLGYVPVSDVKTAALPGTDHLVQEFKTSGTLELSENERLILDAGEFFGQPGSYLYDGALKQTEYLPDAEFGTDVGIIDITKPQRMYGIVEGADTRGRGLYLPAEKKWLLDPVCDSMTEMEDGSWECFRWDEETGEEIRFVWKDGEISEEAEPGLEVMKIGENTWKEKEGHIEIYGPDGKLKKTLEGSDYGMSYGYAQENHYIMLLEPATQIAFDEDGNKIFGKEDMNLTGPEALWIQRVDPEGYYIWAYLDGEGKDILWDRRAKKDLAAGDGYLMLDERAPEQGNMHDVYTIERKDGTKEFYSCGNGPLLSSTGKPYAYHAGRGYFGWVDSRGIMLENPAKGTVWNVKSGSIGKTDEGSISAIAEDTFFLYSDSVSSLWQKDKVLMTGTGLRLTYLDSCVAVQDDRDRKREYILREDGSIRYKGKRLPSWIAAVDEQMIAGWDGNYMVILGKDGKEILRVLNADMQED